MFLRHMNRWQAERQREDFADLYVESYDEPPGLEWPNRQAFVARFEEDVQRPGFDLVVAEAPELAGIVYGYRVGRDGAWWTGLRGGVPDKIEEMTASGHVFAVGELMVLPRYRRQGVGGRLVRALLAESGATLAAAQVDPADEVMRAAYRSWGWTRLEKVEARDGIPARDAVIHALRA